MKRLLIFLMILLCSVPLFSQEMMTAPTDKKIKSVYDARPQVIYEMIRQLYYIERTPLSIDPPLYTAVLMENGDLILLPYYENNKGYADAFVGSFLQYSVDYPEITIEDFAEEKSYLAAILVATGVGLFAGVSLTLLAIILVN